MGMGATAKAEINDGDIPIKKKNDEISERPKAPERVPILCQYENGQLVFGFYYDLGTVTVTVINENTGEQWNAVLQTSGTTSINVSENAGSYHIEITTLYNKVYYGDFEIQ